MKIKTPFFILKIELLLLITILVTIFSPNLQKIMTSFYTCYLFILFHELSHILIASIFNREIESLKLSLSGVSVTFKKEKYNLKKENKKDYLKNVFIYLAGPLSNILLSAIFYNVKIIYEINIFLCFLNLLPLYPLDGYNILHNILNLLSLNKEVNSIICDITGYIILFLLFILSIIQIIFLKNITILIFLIYLFVMNKSKKKPLKMERIVSKYAC